MTGRIRDEDIAQVRERASIDQVVGQYVQLRGAGGGSLKGLCPFHNEKTPSLSIDPARGLYHCFGCGKSGDVFSWVQESQSLDFREALELLARRAGVTLADSRTAAWMSGLLRAAGYEIDRDAQHVLQPLQVVPGCLRQPI